MGERPRVYKTEGIVLRRRNIGEADTVFTVFSDGEGKFEAVARGVRKARSRMRGHLEPLTRSSMLLAQGRSLDVFTQAETVDPYRRLREDLERCATALYCAELVDAFVSEHAEQPGLYGLLRVLLEALDAGAEPWVGRFFEVRLLALLGYELQLDACAACGGSLPEEPTLLAPGAGGLVCGDCRGAAGVGRLLGVRGIKVLRFARTCSLAEFAALRFDEALAAELSLVLGDTVRHVLEREPRTRKYIESLIALADRTGRPSGDVVT